MAIRLRKRDEDPVAPIPPGAVAAARQRIDAAGIEIAPLADDPRYAEASRLHRLLADAAGRVSWELELLELEAHFAGKSGSQRATGRDALLRERMDLRRKQLAETALPSSGTPGPGQAPEIRAALRLLESNEVPKSTDRAARLVDFTERAQILDEAVRKQAGIVAQIRTDASTETAHRFADQHNEMLRRIFSAARTLAAEIDAERGFRAAILQAGYDARPDIISAPYLRAALLLGSEAEPDSGISTFRRVLESRGVLR